ncbi:MAG: transcriptional regulator [Anaerolineae bacterium]|jgi:DNA-binding MarR family transcriptional regulator|nr:transcriptional regulator [Anaerolineae bacterium]MBT4457843.1 transcriptional regulator [Anaerolineae bacterium]MBT6061443.1 transcriptional regulator [Anaerolineae bacterium]MBT6321076.1 transcriptional regulator [Anaerolineae bacterium]MBT6812848.1 transcriptional regulator [Anaerolineae bacterium]
MSQNNPEDNYLQRVDEIDRTIHSPTRLKILIVLSTLVNADFTFLTRTTGLTRGNLSANLRKLEEAGYIAIEKGYIERVPRTLVELTNEGRNALQTYNENMRAVLDDLLNQNN